MPKQLTRKEKLKIAKAVKILKAIKKKKRAKKFIDKSHRQNVNIKIGDYSTGGKSVPAASVSHTPAIIHTSSPYPSQNWAQPTPAPALASLQRPIMRGPSFQPAPFIPRNVSSERSIPISAEAIPISGSFIGDEGRRAYAKTAWEFQARYNPEKSKRDWKTDEAHDQIGLFPPNQFPDYTTPPQSSPEPETIGLEYTPVRKFDSDEEVDEETDIPTVKDPSPVLKARKMQDSDEEGEDDVVTIRPRAKKLGRPRLSDEQKAERARLREIEHHKKYVSELGGKPGSNMTIDSMFLKKANN